MKKENQKCFTQAELNYQLIKSAERRGMSDEVSTTINKQFIQQYTSLKLIPVDLACIIINRYETILFNAKEKYKEYRQIINSLVN